MERNSPLSNCEKALSWIGFAQLPRWCQLGLSTVEVSYHVRKADIGKTLDESLAQPWELQEQGFVLLLNDFVFLLNVLQVLLHGGDLWGREHGRVTNPHQHPAPLGLNAWPRTQTWDWSFTMAASISELDSFSSLISLFSCLISSSFSRTAGEKVTGSQQMLLGK